jgi:sensor histidine kinase YesM
MRKLPENDSPEDEFCAEDPQCLTQQRGQSLGSRIRSVLMNLWPLIIVPIVLTALFLNYGGAVTLPRIGLTFLVNLIIAICIGGAFMAFYALGPGEWIDRARSRQWKFTLHLLGAVFCLVVGVELSIFLLRHIPGLPAISVPRTHVYRIAAVVVAVIWTIEFVYTRLRYRTREVELREERARRDALKAQLETLQARTDPHFLYNSLNMVAGLIEEDPALAEKALEKLSGLFRYALEGSRKDRVSLGEELAAVKGYLEVQALRLGERFRYEIDADDGIEALSVPPLILQPLVENAVLHGISPRVDGGCVRIRAARHDGVLELCVEDDGPGPGNSTRSGTRTSLRDLHERLELLYEGEATLLAERSEKGGYRVLVELPLSEPQA